jgi:lysophospholipase L1-like esterase
MKFQKFTAAVALVAIASLTGCGGGSSSNFTSTTPVTPPPAASLTSNLVGVGDSLTAGFQSNGWLGAAPGSIANPLCTPTPAPGCAAVGLGVPPGQMSGFWAQLWMQANGASPVEYASLAHPTTSVLPLIAAPGLGDQVVNANPALTGGLPFGNLPTVGSCDSFNQLPYTLSGAQQVRESTVNRVADLGIPGLTLHESITLTAPPSPSCVPIKGANAVVIGLQSLLSESGSFYPVMQGFPNMTQLQAAVSEKPTLTTVWLGANDVLHYAFSGGAFTGIDGIGGNTAQVQQDITTVITALQKAGSKVVVANLPDVLHSPFYMSTAAVNPATDCAPGGIGSVQTIFTCIIAQVVGPTSAVAINAEVAATYNLGTTGGGYVTLPGAITTLTWVSQGKVPNLDGSFNGTTFVSCGYPGCGLGENYVTPAFGSAVQALNNTLNAGIASAAQATNVPLVDIHTTFSDIFAGCASGCANDPLALEALTINPGKCCTLTFGGGLVSFDGLHPSNTGYALVAQAFIQTINSAYGTNVPSLNLSAQYAGTGTIPFPDPYAQH